MINDTIHMHANHENIADWNAALGVGRGNAGNVTNTTANATPELRFVRRNGLCILQQQWIVSVRTGNYLNTVTCEWRDVPLETEVGNATA